jgi:hypothetical protein
MPSIDDQIDALYQLPLDAFTAARNAFAKTFKGDEAQRVKALPKAAPIPWAVNQLYWRDRRVYDRLMRAGATLRQTQLAALEGKAGDLQTVVSAHRTALADAVERAGRIAQDTGARPDPEALTRMLEALSLSAEQAVRPGRFTEVVRPAGFEALAGLALVATTAPRPKPTLVTRPAPPGRATRTDREHADAERAEARREEQRVAAARLLAEASVRTLTRRMEAAQAGEMRARQALEEAQQATARAEIDLLAAQARLSALGKPHQP